MVHLQWARHLEESDPAKALEHCLAALDDDPLARRLRGLATYNWPLQLRASLLGRLDRRREALEAWLVYESCDGSTETAVRAILDLIAVPEDFPARLRYVHGRCAADPLYAGLELRRWVTWVEGRMARLREALKLDDAAAPLPRERLGEVHQRPVLEVALRFAGGDATARERRTVMTDLGVHRELSPLRAALTDDDRQWLDLRWRRLRERWADAASVRREAIVAACLLVAAGDPEASRAAGAWLVRKVFGPLLRDEGIYKQDEVVDWLACAGAMTGVETRPVEAAWQDGILDGNEEQVLKDIVTRILEAVAARAEVDLQDAGAARL